MGTLVQFPVSDRDIPLMDRVPNEKAILTMENYCKWYCFYLIHPGGKVEAVSAERGVELVAEKYGFEGRGDHAYHPMTLVLLAEEMGVDWGQQAFELMLGRWMMEVEYNITYPKWVLDSMGVN